MLDDFELGAGVCCDGVEGVVGVVGVVDWVLAVEAADAPLMPASAPPVTSAPATIVAPSSLDILMG
ncbi:MAG: hypothetical protein ABSG95_12670 [Solirubrobacteraceae bacterium]